MAARIVLLAEHLCEEHHAGQFRKVSNKPYYTHPFEVRDILKKYGYDDPITQVYALLHDILEDTKMTVDLLNEHFGYEISSGVYILSRNKGRTLNGEKLTEEEYKNRIEYARPKIQRVKIADNIHNTIDLKFMKQETIERRVQDAINFYIPLGKNIAPKKMIQELEQNIASYRKVA